MLILLAGLSSRPTDVVEAPPWTAPTPGSVFRYLTLPHLRRYLELGALLGSIYIVQKLRRGVHHHLRWAGHRQPALHDLPDVLRRARLRAGLGGRGESW